MADDDDDEEEEDEAAGDAEEAEDDDLVRAAALQAGTRGALRHAPLASIAYLSTSRARALSRR